MRQRYEDDERDDASERDSARAMTYERYGDGEDEFVYSDAMLRAMIDDDEREAMRVT